VGHCRPSPEMFILPDCRDFPTIGPHRNWLNVLHRSEHSIMVSHNNLKFQLRKLSVEAYRDITRGYAVRTHYDAKARKPLPRITLRRREC